MIKAIVIDDEERARRVMKNLLQDFCEGVEVVAVCEDVPEAVLKINELKPDVVFCDIEMPKYSGLQLLSFFENPKFEIIFATGYSEFAVKAFEMSAIDYLLKPIQIEKLEGAIEKLKKRLDVSTMSSRLEALKENLNHQTNKIAIPTSDGLTFIDTREISLLDADGAYTNIHFTNGERLLVSKNLKFFDILLNDKSIFYRIHRSSIVNINSIVKYSKSESYIALENGQIVTVSRNKKAPFEAYIADIKL